MQVEKTFIVSDRYHVVRSCVVVVRFIVSGDQEFA